MTHILNKYFDNIYMLYINDFELDRGTYKMLLNGINVEYFLGVDGKKELYEIFTENRPKTSMKTVGAFGHVHSVIKIMENAIEKKYKRILILEPDIYLAINFNAQIEKYLKMDYKLLYLGASQHDWTYIDKNYDFLLKNGYYVAYNTCGTFAVAIDHSVFAEYLGILRKLLVPSDVCLYELQKKYKHECIVVYPNLISCDVTKSTTTNRWRNQMLLAKKLRWNREYDVKERYTFDVNCNSFYKVFLEVNYHEKGLKGSFIVDYGEKKNTKFIVPNNLIMEKKTKMVDEKQIAGDNYTLFIIPKKSKVYVYIENFFIDNIYFFEFYKNTNTLNKETYHLIRTKLLKFSLAKDKIVVDYYDDMLKNLKIK